MTPKPMNVARSGRYWSPGGIFPARSGISKVGTEVPR